MANFISYDRSQALLFPPDLRGWVPKDDVAHFIIGAVERVDLCAFEVNWTGTGKAQYHPRMMLVLLKVGMVSIDGRKIDANASKSRSIRYDCAQDLRAKLEEDIASRAGAAVGCCQE